MPCISTVICFHGETHRSVGLQLLQTIHRATQFHANSSMQLQVFVCVTPAGFIFLINQLRHLKHSKPQWPTNVKCQKHTLYVESSNQRCWRQKKCYRPCHMQQRTVHSVFRCALKVVMVAELETESSRQLVPWYWMPWIESWSLSPADRVVVGWRISEYELVDDDEASHADKLVVLSEFYT